MNETTLNRGVEGIYIAPVTKDTVDEYTTGPVVKLASVREINESTEQSIETRFYDNAAAFNIKGSKKTTLTIDSSALSLEELALITGGKIDDNGIFIDGEQGNTTFSLGFIYKNLKGEEVFTQYYKGSFSTPSNTYLTEDDGTDANGNELTFNALTPINKFEVVAEDQTKLERVSAIKVKDTVADIEQFKAAVLKPADVVKIVPELPGE